jgi:nucleotide-binding universal stress UspA family protein
MTSLQPLYLVPYDFTEVAEYALNLAFQLAEKNDRDVYLLHVSKNHHDKLVARKNFTERVEQLTEAQKKRITTKVIVGDIFEDLAKAGHLLNASMIVMGTHGAKGFQKLFGSNAEKIISASTVPVLIVREMEELESFKTIVMPFSFEKESIQVLRYAAALAKEMDSTIYLAGQYKSDEWLAGHLKVNQTVARTFLTEHGIKHEVVNLPMNKSFQKELVSYAQEIDAGLIAATYYNESILPRPNTFIQEMIENKAVIPLLTINAEEISVASSVLSFMTN